MQLQAEEDEKSPDNFINTDERLYEAARKVLELKSEDLTKAMSSSFIDHVLQSHTLPGVS